VRGAELYAAPASYTHQTTPRFNWHGDGSIDTGMVQLIRGWFNWYGDGSIDTGMVQLVRGWFNWHVAAVESPIKLPVEQEVW